LLFFSVDERNTGMIDERELEEESNHCRQIEKNVIMINFYDLA
jgi:hypothetical protein